MPFEKYTPPKKDQKTAEKPPQARTLKGGQVSLNGPAYEQFMQGAKFVELFYDSDARKIGLKPKKYATKAGYPIRVVGKGKKIYRVNIKPLFEHYGITLQDKKSVKPVWNAEEGLLEIGI